MKNNINKIIFNLFNGSNINLILKAFMEITYEY